MQKNPTTLNLTRATKDYLIKTSESLKLTISSFGESIIMSYAFENGYFPVTSELENLRKSFLTNSRSNLTGRFRNQLLTFDEGVRPLVIAFFYRLNLIEDFRISTNVMANIYKGDALCYLAFGRIGRNNELVSQHLASSRLCICTLGPSTASDCEYLFFSNYQQFKVRKPYPLFLNLLITLGLPTNCNIIKVHFTELKSIADAISGI